jgi:N-ethylmaleimide reductase
VSQNGNLFPAMLFAPFQLGPISLANRIVMAPMSRNRADADDAPHALTTQYYEQRASAGLIVTEAAPISLQGRSTPNMPGVYSDRQVAGWKKVTQAVHGAAGKIFLQLWHAGRISHPSFQPNGALPMAPSAITPAGTLATGAGALPYVTPRELSTEEVRDVVGEFAGAARNAKEAGFDGIELHAGNGYLIDQFLRDGSNHRTDDYGGSLQHRARLLIEITSAVSAIWGAGRVGVRLSPASAVNDMRDSNPQQCFNYLADALGDGSLAFIHVDETSNEPFDWRAFRSRYRGVYIANRGYDRARAIAAIDNGHADLVSFGLLYIANPDLVARFRVRAPLNVPDRSTLYGGDQRGYTDYPTLAESPTSDVR